MRTIHHAMPALLLLTNSTGCLRVLHIFIGSSPETGSLGRALGGLEHCIIYLKKILENVLIWMEASNLSAVRMISCKAEYSLKCWEVCIKDRQFGVCVCVYNGKVFIILFMFSFFCTTNLLSSEDIHKILAFV